MTEKQLKNVYAEGVEIIKKQQTIIDAIAKPIGQNIEISDEELNQLDCEDQENNVSTDNIYSKTVNYTNNIRINIIEKAKNFLIGIKNNNGTKKENKIKAMENIINLIIKELNEINKKTEADYRIKEFLEDSIKKCKNEFKNSKNLEDKIIIFENSIKEMENENKKYFNTFSREVQKNSKIKLMAEQSSQNKRQQNKKNVINNELDQENESKQNKEAVEPEYEINKEFNESNKKDNPTEKEAINKTGNSDLDNKIQDIKREKNIFIKAWNSIKTAFLSLFKKANKDLEQQQENIKQEI